MISFLGNHTLDKKFNLCTGCAACVAICANGAIEMAPNSEGFLHPIVNSSSCSQCGICRKICPVNRRMESWSSTRNTEGVSAKFPMVWAAWNLDEEVRRYSSSGGIFSALGETVLDKGGVVVGAAFDEKLVVRHCIIEKPTELNLLRGSKYVQSEISPTIYQEVQDLLKIGRTVLFSGTPCQVAGMRNQLQSEDDHFLCCDVVCHGVPSPRLLDYYIQAKLSKGEQLKNIQFRDKSRGWKDFGICWHLSGGGVKSLPKWADPYLLSFLRDINLRICCYDCKFANVTRQGDVTLGDFWGVGERYPEYDENDEGTSLVLVNNPKGQAWLNENRTKIFLGVADLDVAIAGNSSLVRPAKRPRARDTFYHDLEKLTFEALIDKYQLCLPPFYLRVIRSLKRRIMSLIN